MRADRDRLHHVYGIIGMINFAHGEAYSRYIAFIATPLAMMGLDSVPC